MARKNGRDITQILTIERLFLIVGAVFGLLLVFYNPPFHTNDEDRHFIAAYLISDGYIISEKRATKTGGEIPKNLVNVVKSYQGIPFFKGTKISKDKMEKIIDTPLNPDDKVFHHNFSYKMFPLAYAPAAIGISVGKVFNTNPVWLGWFGRIGSLVFYLLILYFAIRITPVFKSVFFLYGLTPMVIYQGASVTYDVLSNSLSFLLVAIFLKFALEKDAVMNTKDIIAIVIIALVHRYVKNGYFLIPFLFLMIPPRKTGSMLKYILLLVFFVLLYFLPNYTWHQLASSLRPENSPKLKSDFRTNQGEMIAYSFSNPMRTIGNLWANFNHFRQEWVGGVLGRFGYSYTLMPKFFLIGHGLVLILVAFFDSREKFKIELWQKLIIFIVGFGTAAMLIAGMYMESPIGANMIFGFQGRYLVPAVPIILLLLYNSKFENKKWHKWKGLILSAYCIVILIYTVIFINNAMYV